MSLVITVHNEKAIVMGSEDKTLVHNDDGSKSSQLGHEKIYKINPQCAIGITGAFWEHKIFQFFEDLKYDVRNTTDFVEIYNQLLDRVRNSLTLDTKKNERIQLTIAGFNKGMPVIQAVYYFSGQVPKSYSVKTNYFTSGVTSSAQRARDLLKEKQVQDNTETEKLKKVVEEVINQCVIEFPDDLGGKPNL